MNKLLLSILVVSILVCSCDKKEVEKERSEGLALSDSELLCVQDDLKKQLTKEDVMNVLEDYNSGNLKSFAQKSYTIKDKSFKIFEKKSKLKSTSNTNDSIEIYYVTIEDNTKNGFALVSADRRKPGVICYIPNGTLEDTAIIRGAAYMIKYSESNFCRAISQYNLLMDSLKNKTIEKICDYENISIEKYHAENYAKKYAQTEENLILKNWGAFTYGPVTSTQWGQDEPYNNKCTHMNCTYTRNGRALAGCVAIAVGQILSYYRAQSPYLPTFNYDEFMRWSDVPASSTQAANDVSSFVYHIATNIGTSFGCDASGAGSQPAIEFMNKYYTNDNVKFEGVQRSGLKLISSGLEIVFGKNEYGGHAWVIDGSLIKRIEGPEWSLWVYSVHCNFGWNGRLDGWFESLFPFPDGIYINDDLEYTDIDSWIFHGTIIE